MSALYTLPTLADAYDPTNPNAGLSTDDPLYIPDVLGQVRPQTTDQSQAQSSQPTTFWQSIINGITGGLNSGGQTGTVFQSNSPGSSTNTVTGADTGATPATQIQQAQGSFATLLYSSRLILLVIGILLFAAGIFAFKPTQQLIEKATRVAGESAA